MNNEVCMTMMVNRAIAAATADDDALILPRFELRFENLASHPGRGLVLVDLLLGNNGSIAASFPFLCLTALGLTVAPAPGWTQQDVTLVRKMQRFMPLHDEILAPGAEVHCCTISLKYKSAFGGCLEFEPGSERLLADFPNLNLTCAVGAGNYPSRRIVLQVPAGALRKVIRELEEGAAASPSQEPAVLHAV